MDFIKQFFGSKNNRLKAESLTGLVKRKSSAGIGGFVDLNNDLGVMVDGLTVKTPNVLMPYLYARSVATAGMYMQGAVGQEDYEYVQDLFYKFMASVGEGISKEEQIQFQESSFDKALELFPKYITGMTRKSSGLMTMSARSGISLRNALFYAIGKDQEEFNAIVEPVMCSNGVIKAEFCAGFFASGWWDVDDEYEAMPEKLIKYFASQGISF